MLTRICMDGTMLFDGRVHELNTALSFEIEIIPRYSKLQQANIEMLIVRWRQLGFGYAIVGSAVAINVLC